MCSGSTPTYKSRGELCLIIVTIFEFLLVCQHILPALHSPLPSESTLVSQHGVSTHRACEGVSTCHSTLDCSIR